MEGEERGIQLSLGLSGAGKLRRKSLIDINSEPQEEDGENGDDGEAAGQKCETTTSNNREVQADKRGQGAKRKREDERLIVRDEFSSGLDREGRRVVADVEFKRGRLEIGCPSRLAFPGPAFPPLGNGCGFSDGPHCYGPGLGLAWEQTNNNYGNGGSNNGSGGCSSSAISENRSISSQGGCSSDSGSHLSLSRSGKTELDTSSGSETQEPPPTRQLQCASGVNPTSQRLQHTRTQGVEGNNCGKFIFSCASVPCKFQPQEEAAAGSLPIARVKHSIPQAAATKVNKIIGKPPKPLTRNHSVPALAHMPCVSTTGNGPNGRTVTGFLYRYTKAEVSIVCVCHGKSFSPTEFVEHAGGVDILHPLKHITVVPSALA